jgi:two-component system, LytTR family, sensor kinase
MARLITTRRVIRDYGISLVLWLSMAVLVSWQESRLAAQEHIYWTFRTRVVLFGVRYFTIALLTPPIFYIVERWPLHAGRLVTRVVAYVGGYVAFSVTFAVIRWSLYFPWLPQTQTWGPRTPETLLQVAYEMFADIFGVYLAILLAAHAYAYFVNMQQQEREQFELKQALTQSQLQVLRNQMQPHFLFNTLHGIATLVPSDPERARSMILHLSNLLRRSARYGDADLVTLEDDLQFARDYLSIEQMRLGERLEVRWDIQPDTRQLLVPQFLLQPLLENAVKHGIAPNPEGGWMEMSSAQQRDTLRVRVRNSTASAEPSRNGGGVGLSNMQARLRCLYGDDAELSFGLEHGVATTSLILPRLSATSTPGTSAGKDG